MIIMKNDCKIFKLINLLNQLIKDKWRTPYPRKIQYKFKSKTIITTILKYYYINKIT